MSFGYCVLRAITMIGLLILLLLTGRITAFIYDDLFPDFYKCKDGGEVYSGAYLITRARILAERLEPLDLHRKVTCERASFMIFRNAADPSQDIRGAPVQTLDVLDFSVLHLSAYERLQRHYRRKLRNVTTRTIPIQDKLRDIISEGESNVVSRNTREHLQLQLQSHLRRTVAVMPILLGSMGRGHSNIKNRIDYIQACFWSIYELIPTIVVTVSSQEEKGLLESLTNLPFHEIIVLEYVKHRPDALPAATVLESRRRFSERIWSYDYMYYTESDQMLLARDAARLFEYLDTFPQRVLVPHRLMPYPTNIIQQVLNKTVVKTHDSWIGMKCMMPKTNCVETRASWVDVSHASVVVADIWNFSVPLGNSNFLTQSYRPCEVEDRGAGI